MRVAVRGSPGQSLGRGLQGGGREDYRDRGREMIDGGQVQYGRSTERSVNLQLRNWDNHEPSHASFVVDHVAGAVALVARADDVAVRQIGPKGLNGKGSLAMNASPSHSHHSHPSAACFELTSISGASTRQ